MSKLSKPVLFGAGATGCCTGVGTTTGAGGVGVFTGTGTGTVTAGVGAGATDGTTTGIIGAAAAAAAWVVAAVAAWVGLAFGLFGIIEAKSPNAVSFAAGAAAAALFNTNGTRHPTAAARVMGNLFGKVMPRLEQQTLKCMARQNSPMFNLLSQSVSDSSQICYICNYTTTHTNQKTKEID
jgi:hypothetical protein